MEKVNYKVVNAEFFEAVKNRPLKEIALPQEKLEDEKGIVLAQSRKADADLFISITGNNGHPRLLVHWGDSNDYYQGWNMAWEEFTWCLEIAQK